MPPVRSAVLALAALLVPAGAAVAGAVETSAGPMRIDLAAGDFVRPWAFDFLPGGALLVTERGGQLWRVEGAERQPVAGLPEVAAAGQGGLLDVMVPADFARSREVWLTWAAPVPGGAATAAGRGRLSDDGQRLEGFATVFQGDPAPGGRHFGARLVEAAEGTILLTTGERGTGPEGRAAQDPATTLGKVIRLTRDGQRAEVLTLGHRNPQGAARAADGGVWIVDHGARGGDEVNLLAPGANYGWPDVSYGTDYDGSAIGTGSTAPGVTPPRHWWVPSIAPSGLAVYSGALVPGWAGDFFTGSLNGDFLARLDPDTPAATGWAEERLATPETLRVRDVAEGPDGALWFLSETNGAIYRLRP